MVELPFTFDSYSSQKGQIWELKILIQKLDYGPVLSQESKEVIHFDDY